MKTIIKTLIIIILGITSILTFIILGARIINKKNYSIDSVNGVEFYGFLELGGIKQYVQIRGENRDNPVIVFVHGGPGFPITYLSTHHQQYLEDSFTLVNYDQRGSGRTYYENEHVNDELSPQVLEQDLDELVDYLCDTLEKEKVIIMGQSWGTVLGINYVKDKPEKVETYIGVGQVINFDEGKIYSAEKAMDTANEEDREILKGSIDKFRETTSIGDVDVENLESLILTSGKYLSSGKELSGLKQMWLGLTSPTMNLDDMKWFLKASSTEKIISLEKPLINYMYYDFDIYDFDGTYDVPIYFVQGTNDYITPTGMVEEYFNELDHGDKKMILQDAGGHTPFLDDPESFAAIIKDLLKSE